MSKPNAPSKWKHVKLADYARIVSGATPKTSEPRYWDGNICWVTPKDISDLAGYPFLDATPRTLTAEGLASCSAEILPPGSVLLSSRAPIGLVAINRIPVATNQGFKSFVPDAAHLDAGFLYHWLRTNRAFLESLGAGATFKEISKAVVSRIEIPLPLLDEQKRIAAVLDKADALRRQRRESLQLIERLLQSVFIQMFGDPVMNPKGWPTQQLRQFGTVHTGNTPPRSNKANYAATGLEWIKTDNIVEGQIYVTSAVEKLSATGVKAARIARTGSLLVACIAGSEKSIGRAALTDRPVAFNQQINVVAPHANTSPLFLYFLMKVARRQVQLAAGKGMKKIINKSTFENLVFISPGREEQQQFEAVAQILIGHSQDCRGQLPHLDELLSSIQQRAFRGDLDLGRLVLGPLDDAPPAAVLEIPATKAPINKAALFIQAPHGTEAALKELDDIVSRGESIPWSADYFKYRVLGTQPSPFSFGEVMQAAESVFDEPLPYEEIKEIVLALLGHGGSHAILKQRFDLHIDPSTKDVTGRKEIVFEPTA